MLGFRGTTNRPTETLRREKPNRDSRSKEGSQNCFTDGIPQLSLQKLLIFNASGDFSPMVCLPLAN